MALSEATWLHLFLHNRASCDDLVKILTDNRDKMMGGGVVHSFDGSAISWLGDLNLQKIRPQTVPKYSGVPDLYLTY